MGMVVVAALAAIAAASFSAAINGRTPSISEVDLVGHTLRETDIIRLAEQLDEFGIKSVCKTNGQQCVSGFHHDAIELPNGHIIAIGTLERVIPAGAQGSEDPVNIAGTLLFDLDQDLQVKWVWNSFDHLDLKRRSLADGHCRGPVGSLPCAPGCSSVRSSASTAKLRLTGLPACPSSAMWVAPSCSCTSADGAEVKPAR